MGMRQRRAGFLQLSEVIVLQKVESSNDLPACVLGQICFQQVLFTPEPNMPDNPIRGVITRCKNVVHMNKDSLSKNRQQLKEFT